MKVLFFIRRSRVDKLGEAPIYFRVTINGERLEPPRNTGVRVKPCFFKNQRTRSASDNLILDSLEHQLKTIHSSQIARGKTPSLKSVIIEFDGKSSMSLFELAEHFFSYCETHLVNNIRLDYEERMHPDTVKTYRYKFEHIRRYYEAGASGPPQANELDAFELSEIVDWLRIESEIELQRSTIARIVTVVKKIIAFGYKKGYLEINPIKDFVYSRASYNEPLSLDIHQLHKILNYPFTSPLYEVANVFLLQCYTGMEFRDILKFAPGNIVFVEGLKYISYKRQKNGNVATIPVSVELEVVLQRFSFKTPNFSHHNYNVKLKRVADKAGVDVELTMRVGRKTFYNKQLNEECYSYETVAAMMGHKKVGSGKHYGFARPELVINETKKRSIEVKWKV